MTNDDIDLEPSEEFEKGPEPKPSLKEAWDNNPMLKIGALVVALSLAAGGYLMFFSTPEEGAKSVVSMSGVSEVKSTPGLTELDPAYHKAVDETNKANAKQEADTGGSALPIPVSSSKTGNIDIPEEGDNKKTDVLAEWRSATETTRLNQVKQATEEESAPPEVVAPMQPVRVQPTIHSNPDMVKALAEQMRVIIEAQTPPKAALLQVTQETAPYIVQKEAEKQRKAEADNARSQNGNGQNGSTASNTSMSSDSKKEAAPKTIVPAGSIAYAQLMTELNSDIEGPALAQVLSGPFEGGRAIGKVEVKDEYMVISFSRIVKDAVTYSMDGVALDEKTTLAGQATDVDHHYLVRVILPAAAKFIEGYGSAQAETGQTAVSTAGGGSSTTTPKPTAKENIYKGVEEASKKMSEILDKAADRPITVKVAKGTTMGIFFLNNVTTEDAGK